MKYFLPAALSAILSIFPLCAQSSTEKPGNIVFFGDSVTHGGSYLLGPVPSYRYQLFKIFVDNGIEFSPMGMTHGASKNVDVSALTPDYRGHKFINRSEAAASARTYHFSSHPKGAFKKDPRTVFPIENRGPLSVKLGLKNKFTGTFNTFYDGDSLSEYSGSTYKSEYEKRLPDTLCVLIGINDLADKRKNSDIASDVSEIVKSYQKYNPKIRVHVFEVLPTGRDNPTGTNKSANYAPYNEYLRTQVKAWSTSGSTVTIEDISDGFYAEDGSMIDTARGVHPTAQGELILAGNIARVLGIGQRNCGFPQKDPCDRQARSDFRQSPGYVKELSGSRAWSATGNDTSSWHFSGEGLKIESMKQNAVSDIRTSLHSEGKGTFEIYARIKMLQAGKENMLSILCGDDSGETGILCIGEDAIFWDETILYGTKSSTDKLSGFMTKAFHDIKIAHRAGEGFYVWLDGQLIGEKLAGTKKALAATACKNSILLGDIHQDFVTRAEISEMSWDSE